MFVHIIVLLQALLQPRRQTPYHPSPSCESTLWRTTIMMKTCTMGTKTTTCLWNHSTGTIVCSLSYFKQNISKKCRTLEVFLLYSLLSLLILVEPQKMLNYIMLKFFTVKNKNLWNKLDNRGTFSGFKHP